MDIPNETLRFPTHLDREAIVARLIRLRDAAKAAGVEHLATAFADPDAMTSGQLGAAVVSALSRIQQGDEHRALAAQLEIVAMNLKNLKA